MGKRRISLAGPKRKRLPPQRIYRGEGRKVMVGKVMDVLRDWRLSPFEREGTTRAGIRAALVLEGHGWQKADAEAAGLVAEGLRLLGAVRPSYGEGQKVYTLGRDMCAHCLGPLDDEDMAARRRFCCDECRTMVKARDADLFTYLESFAMNAGYYAAFKEGLPDSDCEWCGQRYKMQHLKQRFCSKSCAQHERAGDRLVKVKPCLHCRNPFRGAQVEQKFCSAACHVGYVKEHGPLTRLPERHCDVCKSIFRPKTAQARWCSPACGNTAKVAYNRMKREEKRKEWQKPTPCQWCGETFTPAKPSNVFCGRDCNDKAQKAKKKARREASTFICEEVKEAA